MSEFAPPWSNPRMTKAQVRKYIKELEEKRKKAKEELEKYEKSWELEKEKEKLKEIEDMLEDVF